MFMNTTETCCLVCAAALEGLLAVHECIVGLDLWRHALPPLGSIWWWYADWFSDLLFNVLIQIIICIQSWRLIHVTTAYWPQWLLLNKSLLETWPCNDWFGRLEALWGTWMRRPCIIVRVYDCLLLFPIAGSGMCRWGVWSSFHILAHALVLLTGSFRQRAFPDKVVGWEVTNIVETFRRDVVLLVFYYFWLVLHFNWLRSILASVET